jgi:hypothetical protein
MKPDPYQTAQHHGPDHTFIVTAVRTSNPVPFLHESQIFTYFYFK